MVSCAFQRRRMIVNLALISASIVLIVSCCQWLLNCHSSLRHAMHGEDAKHWQGSANRPKLSSAIDHFFLMLDGIVPKHHEEEEDSHHHEEKKENTNALDQEVEYYYSEQEEYKVTVAFKKHLRHRDLLMQADNDVADSHGIAERRKLKKSSGKGGSGSSRNSKSCKDSRRELFMKQGRSSKSSGSSSAASEDNFGMFGNDNGAALFGFNRGDDDDDDEDGGRDSGFDDFSCMDEDDMEPTTAPSIPPGPGGGDTNSPTIVNRTSVPTAAVPTPAPSRTESPRTQ
jgi:hypothetical protein